MKNSAVQFAKQYVQDAKSNCYIDGNVAEYLILNTQSEDQGYQSWLSDEEIEEYENANSERRQEIRNEIEKFIKEHFDIDVENFNYYNNY
jgi:hypothetical protein